MMQYDVFLIGLGSSCIMLQWSDQQRIGKDRTIVRKVKGVCVGGWVGGEDQKGKRSVGVGGCSYSLYFDSVPVVFCLPDVPPDCEPPPSSWILVSCLSSLLSLVNVVIIY